MDRVTADFRERVAALWRCCDNGYHFEGFYEGCLRARVPDCAWTMKSKDERIWFSIGHDNGEWKYCFTNPDRTRGAKKRLSMDELQRRPNWKNVRIQSIEVSKTNRILMHPLRSRADIERLLNFVFFLSNEPELELCSVHGIQSPEGAILLNWLSKMTFSSVKALKDFPVSNQLLENQFSSRRPTTLDIESISRNREFFIEHLGNGNIKRFTGPWGIRFPAEVMERIIDRFLENPENYDKNQFRIDAHFEESTKEMLERNVVEGRCKKSARNPYSTEYRFTANNPKLKRNLWMRIRNLAFGSIISID